MTEKGIKTGTCIVTAKALINKGKSCGIDMSKYRADSICNYYHDEESMSESQIVGRLELDAESCSTLEIAVKGDRIGSFEVK